MPSRNMLRPILFPSCRFERSAALALACAFLISASLLLSGTATAASLALEPPETTANVFQQVTIDLRIDGLGNGSGPSLGGFDLRIDFDPAVLQVASVLLGDPGLGNQMQVGGFGSIQRTANATGSVSLFELALAPSSTLDGSQASSFVLARLQFDLIDQGISDVVIDPGALLSDAVGNAIAVSGIQNAIVSSVPEPSAALLFSVGLYVASRSGVRRPR